MALAQAVASEPTDTTPYEAMPLTPQGAAGSQAAAESKSTVASAVVAINETVDLLKAFANHYLIHLHPKSSCYKTGKFLLLAIASISSMWMYIKPSWAYGKRMHSEVEGVQQVIGNMVTSFFAMLNISQIYMNYLEKLGEAEEGLAEFVDRTDKLKKQLENYLLVFGGAFASALPLTAAALIFNEDDPLWVRILQSILTQFDYTLNHTLPLHLLLHTPWPRRVLLAPFAPLYYPFYEWPRQCSLTAEETYHELLAEQTKADRLALKSAQAGVLAAAKTRIFHESFAFDYDAYEYAIEFPAEVKQIANMPEGMDQYTAILDCNLRLMQEEEQAPRSRKLSNWFNNYVDPFLSSLAWTVGALIVPIGVTGFLRANFTQLTSFTKSTDAAYTLTSPAALDTWVLAGYFGGKTIQGIYDYLIARFVRKNDETPLAIRLYPKTVALLLALSVYFAYYCSGTAEELIYRIFDDPDRNSTWDLFRDVLLGCARYGLMFFGYTNMVEIIFAYTLRYAKKYGLNDEKFAAELAERIEDMQAGIFLLDDDQYEQSLQDLPSDNRCKLLGMSDNKFKQLTHHEANLKAKLEKNSYWCSFLKTREVLEMLNEPAGASVQATDNARSTRDNRL